MIDPKTKEKITISTSGTAGPYIIIDSDLTEKVVDLLRSKQISLSVDKGASTTGSGSDNDVINLHGKVDVDAVQLLLDHEEL